MSEPTSATYYATVRAAATALRLWHQGDKQGVNDAVAGLPQGLYIGASMTLAEALAITLANLTGKDFDTMVESHVAQLIGLESEGNHE
jgi:hypothetical protein